MNTHENQSTKSIREEACFSMFSDLVTDWDFTSKFLKSPSSPFAVTGNQMGRTLAMNIPCRSPKTIGHGQQLILTAQEPTPNPTYGTNTSALPNILYFPFAFSNPRAAEIRITIARGLIPKTTIPTDMDDPCFPFCWTAKPDNHGLFWVEFVFPRIYSALSQAHCRITSQPFHSNCFTYICKQKPPFEETGEVLIPKGIIIARRCTTQGFCNSVYLVSKGAPYCNNPFMPLHAADFDGWTSRTCQPIMMSIFIEGNNPSEEYLPAGNIFIRQPKFIQNDVFADCLHQNSISIFSTAKKEYLPPV